MSRNAEETSAEWHLASCMEHREQTAVLLGDIFGCRGHWRNMSVGVVSYPMLRETRSNFWLVIQDTPGYLLYNMIFNPHPPSVKGLFVYSVFPFLLKHSYFVGLLVRNSSPPWNEIC